MPEIKPFRALRYNPGKIKNLASVCAPPYDVISKAGQEKLYAASRYNVIRLELGKDEKGDTERDNRYTRAAGFLHHWKHEKILVREEKPALYVYVQDYPEQGQTKTRIGFLAAMKIDEKTVLRHENTLAAPKKDRLALLKATRTNLSPIFGLFEDKEGLVRSQLKNTLKLSPIVDVSIGGVRHRIFLEAREAVIKVVQKEIKSKPMFIADGHHRFEVACQFKNWMKSQSKGDGGDWEYVMTYFSDCLHNPFKIFPTHRLVRLPKKTEALVVLRKRGTLEKAKDLAAVLKRLSKNRDEEGVTGRGARAYDFGIYTKKDGFYIFTLDKKYAYQVKQNPVDKLDVAVLHHFLIEPCFGIHSIEKSLPRRQAGDAIDFTRDAKEAEEKVKSGLFDAALFLRPTSLKEMMLASKKGLKMPQKSTYFYPKLLSGLVFHSFDEKGSCR